MGAVVAAAWTGARQRIVALAGLALVVAVGVGVSLAAYEAATRTRRAYPSYLRNADVGELVVNPSLSTDRAEELITSTPGVLDHRTDDLLSATFDDGAPRTQAEVDSVTTQVRMSSDGRYADQDRPVVHEGRMLRPGAREAFLSREAAEGLGVSVGDDLPFAFWSNSYNTPGVGAGQADLVEPIGRTSARVVGIGVLPDEVLVDELYPRQRVLVTPEVGGPYTCTIRPIDPDDDRPIVEIAAAIPPRRLRHGLPVLLPPGRRRRRRRGRGGRRADRRVRRGEHPHPRGAARAGHRLPAHPSATRDQRDRVERSVSPAVTALRSFALAAGLATVVVAALGALRVARRDSAHTGTWRSLGMTRGQRFLAIGLPLAAAVLAGTAAAVAIGFALSGFGPVASVRAVEPGTRLGLSGHVLLVVLGVAGALLLAGVAVAAAAVVRAEPEAGPRRRSLLRPVTQLLDPARGLGVLAAARGAGAGAVLVGSTAAVGWCWRGWCSAAASAGSRGSRLATAGPTTPPSWSASATGVRCPTPSSARWIAPRSTAGAWPTWAR